MRKKGWRNLGALHAYFIYTILQNCKIFISYHIYTYMYFKCACHLKSKIIHEKQNNPQSHSSLSHLPRSFLYLSYFIHTYAICIYEMNCNGYMKANRYEWNFLYVITRRMISHSIHFPPPLLLYVSFAFHSCKYPFHKKDSIIVWCSIILVIFPQRVVFHF